MRHTLICPQFGGQVDQLGGEIWEEAQQGQRSDAETKGGTSNTREARRRTSCVSGKNVIHQSVCCELSNILRGNVFVEGLQLGLALVELLVVALEISIRPFSKRALGFLHALAAAHLLQSDACVALIHFHCEFSPHSLNLDEKEIIRKTPKLSDFASKRQES